MKKEFDSQEIIQNRHKADLGGYGDFRAEYIEVDPESPETIFAVGSLFTLPKHLEEIVEIQATLEIDLERFWQPEPEEITESYPEPDWPPAEVVEKMDASVLFNAPWRSWHTEDIPEDWEY